MGRKKRGKRNLIDILQDWIGSRSGDFLGDILIELPPLPDFISRSYLRRQKHHIIFRDKSRNGKPIMHIELQIKSEVDKTYVDIIEHEV